MTQQIYRYGLPKKAKKTECPGCGHAKTFTQYIDNETGELLPEEFGRCDRESNCGYHLSPYHKGPLGMSYADELKKQDVIPQDWFKAAFAFKRNGTTKQGISHTLQTMMGATPKQADYVATYVYEHSTAKLAPEQIHCIPDALFRASLGSYQKNQFALLLTARFGIDEANRLLSLFQIGSSSRWPGATVFWYIDEQGRIRGGQIKLFGLDWHTEKYVDREGKKRSKTDWVHSAYTYRLEKANVPLPDWLVEYNEKAERSPCLFGLPQLLTASIDKPVAVVESPKTSIICTFYFPEFTWLAAGALSYLNAKRMEPLRGRKVMLFPDLNAYDTWSHRADELRAKGFLVEVSDLLESIATDEQRSLGLDLADFLLEQRPVVSTIAEQLANPGAILKPNESQLERLTVEPCNDYPADWDAPNSPDAIPTIHQLTYRDLQPETT